MIKSVMFRNWPFKVSYSYSFGYNKLQKLQNFEGKFLKINQKLHGGDRRYRPTKVCNKKKKISKSTNELFFTPMPTSIVHISK